MSDYIDRQAVIDVLCKRCMGSYCGLPCVDVKAIERLPFVEVEPVKRGEWIKVSDRNYKCSVCGDWWNGEEEDIKTFIYCPNCGAKMENGEEA